MPCIAIIWTCERDLAHEVEKAELLLASKRRPIDCPRVDTFAASKADDWECEASDEPPPRDKDGQDDADERQDDHARRVDVNSRCSAGEPVSLRIDVCNPGANRCSRIWPDWIIDVPEISASRAGHVLMDGLANSTEYEPRLQSGTAALLVLRANGRVARAEPALP